MTEVRVHTERANVAPDAPEVHEHNFLPIDEALFAAFEGEFGPALALPDSADQRAIAFAARRFGMTPPDYMDSRSLSFSDVADRLGSSWSITNLYLAAEKFSGDRTRAEKVKRGLSVATKVAVFIPDLVLGAVGAGAGKMHLDRTAKGFEIAAAVPGAVVHKPFEMLHEAGPNKLFVGVRHFIKSQYGVEYNSNPARVLAWLRAAVLGAAAASPYTSNETLQELAGDFWQASQGFVVRGEQGAGKRSEGAGVPYLRIDLRNGMDIREAAGLFVQEEAEAKAAREKAARDYFLPKPSLRPSGAELNILRISADVYNGNLDMPYGFIVSDMREAAALIGTVDHGQGVVKLADLMSICLERLMVRDDPFAARFGQLFMNYVEEHGFSLANYVRQNRFSISQNLAGVGLLRLADHMVRSPDIWGYALGTDATPVERAVTKAAFDWFDHPRDLYSHMPEVAEAVRRAHIQGVSGLAGPPSSMPVRRSRASQLLGGLPSHEGRRKQIEQCLPQEAVSQLRSARKLLGRRA